MSASTASADSHAATAPDASAPAALAPMDLKIPITGVVVLLLQGLMALGARGSTTFDLTASSDLFRLGAPELNARLVILAAAGIVAAAAGSPPGPSSSSASDSSWPSWPGQGPEAAASSPW